MDDPQQSENSNGEREAAAKRSTWVSVLLNLVLTAVQLAAGLASGSQALVADAVHSLSDLGSDLVVLFALRHSKKAADHDHHYGHQRYENAASLVLGALMLAVGLGMIWAAAEKMRHPQAIPAVGMLALWVALLALVVKEALFRYMLAVAQRVRSTLLVSNAWHARSDAASSLVVAVGVAGNLMGFTLLDPIAASFVGLMVARMGGKFLWQALADLTDRAASQEETQRIREEILAVPGVRGVHELRTRKTGDLILVDVHLEVPGEMTVAQGHAIALEARDRVLKRHHVLSVMTHVDPV